MAHRQPPLDWAASMDGITPVGSQVQPMDPSKGLQLMSGMLGLQQQKQELAAGAANLHQTQQRDQELSALANLTRNAMQPGSKYWKGGEFDVDGYRQDATSVAPVYGPQAIDQHISSIKNVVGTREAFLKLGDETNKTISDAAKGLATKQGPITDTDIDTFADNMKSTIGASPEAQYRLGQFVGAMRGAQDPQGRARVAQNGSAILGGFMQQTPSTMSTGAQDIPGTTGVFGGGFTPAQTDKKGNPVGIAKQMPPQIFIDPRTQIPTKVGGVGNQGAPTTGAGTAATGPTPTGQDWHDFGEYNAKLNGRVSVASQSLPRIQAVEQALEGVKTGAGTEFYAGLAKKLQALGAPQSVYDKVAGGNLASIQEAEKMLFQTTLTGLEQSMTGDPHVAQFNAANKVFPNVDTDPRAREMVLGFLRDQGNRDFAEQQALKKARTEGSFNPSTWQAQYQQKLREGQTGAPASQVPKPANQPQERRSKDKNGEEIVFRGGRWEYVNR